MAAEPATVVLDASAILALVFDEPGADLVEAALDGSIVSAVNLSEAVAKLSERGASAELIREKIAVLRLNVLPFGEADAYDAGLLRPTTMARGLSFGDRACLALATKAGLPALTSDAGWRDLDLSVDIRLIR